MTIAAILKHKGGAVFWVRPSDTAIEVSRALADRRIGAALVLDGTGDDLGSHEILGIVSERDIVRSLASNGAATLEMTAGQLMTRVLHTVGPASTVAAAMEKMTANRVRHLPVLEGGALVGMISIGDVVKARIMATELAVDSLTAYVAGA